MVAKRLRISAETLRAKELRGRKTTLRESAEAESNRFQNHRISGDIAGHQKQWEEAIRYYKKLKLQFPKIANYHYKFGGALGMKAKTVNKFKALGMIDDIKEAFETAANLDKKHIDTRWALVMLYIELPGIVGGSETKAQNYAEELMQLSKVDGFLAKGYIDVYFKRYAKAEIHLKKAHEIGQSKTTYEKLYDLYLNKLKNMEKAQKLKADFQTQFTIYKCVHIL